MYGNGTDADYLVASACANAPSQSGFSYDAKSRTVVGPPGLGGTPMCIDSAASASQLRLAPCTGSPSQTFDFSPAASPKCSGTSVGACGEITTPTGECLDIYCATNPCGPSLQLNPCHNGSNQLFAFGDGHMHAATGQCIAVTHTDPSDDVKTARLSVWAKPQPNNTMAVFVLSNKEPGQPDESVTVDFSELNFTSSTALVRDIWAQSDVGTFHSSFTTDSFGGHDSRFFLLTPSSNGSLF